jgi:hypothetical protein
MSPLSHVIGIGAAALTLIVVIEMLRRRRLRERHAIWWLVAGILALIIGIFPSVLEWVSDLVGIELPVNLIFFVSIAVLFFVCIQSSSELTSLEEKTRILAEETALLRIRVGALEKSLEPESSKDAPTSSP